MWKWFRRRWPARLSRPWLVRVAALATLGSGLLNVYSVMEPAVPARMRLLRELFPIEFIGLSRSLTLVIGFFLIVSSISIYKRKRRAFFWVVGLACASVVFHLIKGIDYREAALSAFVLGLLVVSRPVFTVKSRETGLGMGLLRLALAFGIAFGYGVAGFWLLGRSEFGVNFHPGQAFREAVLYLSLVGDPAYSPLTRHARWFADSLYLIAIVALIYSVLALFQPVVYRFATYPHQRQAAQRILELYGRAQIDYFKTWPDKSYFFSASGQGFLAYRVGGSFALVLGDPVGPEDEIEELVREFARFCRDNDWNLGFYQVLPDFLPVYRKLGFRRLKIGDDAIVDLSSFTLDDPSKGSLRRAVKKLERAGVRARVCQPPVPETVLAEMAEVSRDWLTIPGRRERGFSLGYFDPDYLRSTPVLAVTGAQGGMLGFANLIPSYRKGEATADLMRRRHDAPNGIMDYVFVKLLLYSREQGFQRFNMGMAPMAGFQLNEEPGPEERAVHAFFQRLNFLFSFKGLRAYKAKFATGWEPRYVVYTNVFQLPRLAIALERVSALKS